jgi:hypothetical protein
MEEYDSGLVWSVYRVQGLVGKPVRENHWEDLDVEEESEMDLKNVER